MFEAPIPGESLTREPKNAAYERPPELNDPEDALIYHIDRLTDERRIGAAVLLLEEGVDIRTLTEGLLRKGVFDGMHSIDVSMIIAPAVHEYIKTTADMVGIDYKDGFETDKEDRELDYQLNSTRALKALSKIDANPKDATNVVEGVKESDVQALEVEVLQEEPMVEAAEEAPRGFMTRRSV